ncbi:hypothetical protein FS837_003659 [Tulasnella sp. UAMH 9824]|nr:hypothetical protein FS837_003659 [Tulasnella sp. UAMH 9824]
MSSDGRLTIPVFPRRLTESELTAAAEAKTPLSSAAEQGKAAPFLPLEIVREIIRHATDTFPAPYSIHYPSPSTSRSLPPPSPHPRFPYSSYAFQEDREIDRKLHALSMKIKLSVSLVSRAWREVAVEFLFNSVRIHYVGQIALLWRAFEGDAKRRGDQASKDTIAHPGSAQWWIRELWIDCEFKMKRVAQSDSTGTPPSSDLVNILVNIMQMCPNIVMYRGVGWWRRFQFPAQSLRTPAALKRILDLPVEWGDQTNGEEQDIRRSELDVLDTGRRIELCFAFEWEASFPLFSYEGTSTPYTLTLPCISAMELRSLYLLVTSKLATYDVIRLPNLVHLTLRGGDSLKYDTRKLVLPSLRSVTFGTVGLYGLEHAGKGPESGESVISNIFKIFPEVTTIQDLSWRSGVIRRRAYTKWTDPDGAKWREFWAQAIRAVRMGPESPLPKGNDDPVPVREVSLLDWRGKPLEAVPTNPPGSPLAGLGPDDRLLDALVSKARWLI